MELQHRPQLILQGALELGRPFICVLNWGKGTTPWHSSIRQSLVRAVPEEGRHVILNKVESSQVAGSGTSLPEAKSLALSPRSP